MNIEDIKQKIIEYGKILKQSGLIIGTWGNISVRNEDRIVITPSGMDYDILKPEKVLKLLYAKELKKIENKRYIIVNKHKHIDDVFFSDKLSVVLKVRSMENFCAVIVESDNINNCYQCGKNRTAQVLKSENGKFGIDLDRTTGPEAIWKNKGTDMKACWRENVEWLIHNMCENL
jgi:hypothetical protein